MTNPDTPTPTLTTLRRRFKVGSTLLHDPDPALTPEQVFAIYARTYPVLASAQIDPNPETVDGELVWAARPPQVQTKGAAKRSASEEAAIAKLKSWLDEQVVPEQQMQARIQRLGAAMAECLSRPANTLDPWLVPMA